MKFLLCQIPRIVKNVRFARLIESFKLDVSQEFAVWIVKLGPAIDLGLEDQGGQKARNRVHGQDVIERPAIEISLAEVPPVLSVAQAGQRVQEGFHHFSWHECISIILRLTEKILHGIEVAEPIGGKYRVGWKSSKRLLLAEHVTEELLGCFEPFTVLGLIIDDAHPGADARERPHGILVVE